MNRIWKQTKALGRRMNGMSAPSFLNLCRGAFTRNGNFFFVANFRLEWPKICDCPLSERSHQFETISLIQYTIGKS